ncbi:MAG: SH3 domain-containing protein [Hyphomonadaceae bacterium]
MRRGITAALVAAAGLFCVTAASADAPVIGPDSNLPVPRYVSLKTQGANGRHGPGLEHRVDWVYQRVGLPLQVIAESGPWRRVVDPDGDAVWIHTQNLDQRRTAYVRAAATLRRQARGEAAAVAHLSPGVIGAFTGCDGEWRRVAVAGRVGWVEADTLWGADCAGL